MADKPAMTIKVDVETGEVIDVFKGDDRNKKAGKSNNPKKLIDETGKRVDLANTTEVISTSLILTKASPGCVTYYHHGQYYTI
jgi:hypothetical protein